MMFSDLYEFLCGVVGSQEIVEIRRNFFNVMNSAMTNNCLSVIFSGSKPEGLDMTGSDIDIMFVENQFRVLNVNEIDYSILLNNNFIYFIADTENANPGFAILRPLSTNFLQMKECLQYLMQMFENTDRGIVVSNSKFKELHLHANNTSFLKIHGPSLSSFDSSFDLVYCLQGSWPNSIQEWISRPRYSGWPTEDLMFDIVQQGVCFVPIGCKFGSMEDNPHEWRISFSIAEKMLIHSFNHVQLLCYAMFKIILTDILKTNDDSCQLLCSYYLKTVMFWVIEENESCFWNPQNFASCFQTCFNRLVYFVTYGYCPNYFIPTNNMFEGKVNGNVQHRLISTLNNLTLHGACIFWQSEILKGFLLKNHSKILNTKVKSKDEIIDSAVYPLLYSINNYLNDTVFIISDYMSTCLRLIRHTSSRRNLNKQLYLFLFCRLCRHLFLLTMYNFENNNIKLYRQFKELRSYVLLGAYYEISGWILVALLFYKHAQFASVRVIVDHVLSECTKDKMLITEHARLKPIQRPCSYESLSFIQRHKLSCMHQIPLEVNENTCLFHLDVGALFSILRYSLCVLKEQICTPEQSIIYVENVQYIINVHGNNDKIFAHPLVFAHFIKFMSYHHQEKTRQKLTVLQDLQLTVKRCNNLGEDIGVGLYLSNAFLLSNYRPTEIISVNGGGTKILYTQDQSYH